MSIDFGLLALAMFIGLLTLFLYDFKRIFIRNKETLKAEAERYQNKFKGNSAEKTRSTATCGTSLSLDQNGNTIITAESRLSFDSYL